MKASALLAHAVEKLEASDAIDHWQKNRELYEAEDLLMHAMGGQEVELDEDVPPRVRRRFEAMVARRAAGEPVPFIKGYAEFRGIQVLARPGVFVPRDSSEFLAEQAVRRLRARRSPVHVDLATGGGPIALAVANEVPKAIVYGADLSPEAVALARTNAKRAGVRATFVVADLFTGLPKRKLAGKVDVVTLHPPYVPRDEVRDLPDEIRAWEPTHTLTDQSEDGMGLVRRAAHEGPEWLARNGWLLVEVSPDRSREVMRILRAAGFREVRSTKGGDLKVTRVVVGRRPA
ncbi:MAG: peptide chain release factor N(5)-glutamine methyltransferase [Actinobacteria bacterium]|nr:peptide chain release factor N(5)-glutamine methyltransferase [Actinomycetota bacterium]